MHDASDPAVIDRRWDQVGEFHLDDMVRGWFVGDFSPTALRLSEAEVAVQRFAAGEIEAEHHHRAAVEITVIVSGRARMCGRLVGPGDILVLPPNTATSFEALEDTVTAVVKTPSVPGDKYPGPYIPEGEAS
jgi:mannose-6-phosphate isomerase-like protein (cupin superfamily)